MVFITINAKNYDVKDKNGKTLIDKLNSMVHDNNNKIFIMIYMEGCGPCNATRPEWAKLKNVLKNTKNNNNIVIVDVDHVLANKLKGIKEPNAFPTMRYITNGGMEVENYEDSNIKNKDRTIDSFVEWINVKTKDNKHHNKKGGKKTINNNKMVKNNNNKTRKRKWSLKYKRSINCNSPKGFSQKQYCKYGRKK
jgi:thiol-disulfide isomerase/thioredoxin